MNSSILDPFKKSDWFHPSDLAAKQAKAIFEGKPKPKLSTEYWDTTYLDALSSNSEPMETIKNKEPEQTQESPSKEIINALVFVGKVVAILYCFYDAYLYLKIPNKLHTLVHQDVLFAVDLTLILLTTLWVISAYQVGEYNTWLKQNIDPHILKIKSWLNRRNEQ